MSPRTIGRRIKVLRQAAGIKPGEFASKAKLDRSDLWRIENGLGPRSMTTARLERIAKALGVPLAALFDDVHGEHE